MSEPLDPERAVPVSDRQRHLTRQYARVLTTLQQQLREDDDDA